MCRSGFSGLKCFAVLGAAALTVSAFTPQASAQVVLWDTGVEHAFNSGAACPCGGAGQPVCTDFFLGFSSGAIAGAPQRWMVQPFAITNAGGATVTEIDIHGFYPAGNEPLNINYIIWRRFGNTTRTDPAQAVAPDCLTGNAICNSGALQGAHLEAPIAGDQVSSGVLGVALATGETDPRGGSGGALYRYRGLCILLAQGEYYLTVYGDGFRAGNTSGFSNFAWFGGAHQPDVSLIRDAAWRAVSFPAPGFAQYNPATLCMDNAAPFPSGERRDVWTTAFAVIGFTTHQDCNTNNTDDFCEVGYQDCDTNGVADFCQTNVNTDCDHNGILDVCEGGFQDLVHYVGGNAVCDGVGDGIADRCQPGYHDCNTNNQADCFDIFAGGSADCNNNNTPDECDAAGHDCNTNGIPDSCEIAGQDCDNNGTLDICEIAANLALDCNGNGILDRCDVTAATSIDCNSNQIPDECEHDCDTNGIADDCDIRFHAVADCNTNGFPDRCDVRTVGTSFRIDQFYSYTTAGGFALASDASLAAGGSQVVAHDFQSPAGMVVNQINWIGGPNLAGGFTAVTDDSWTIRIWTDGGGRPGTVVQSFNVPGADGTLVRFDNAANDANRQYATVLTTPLPLPAGRYWYEAFYTGLNANDFSVIVDPGRPTSGLDAFPLASVVTTAEPWNFFFNLHNVHLLLAMAEYYADANTNGTPDECETPTFPGTCASGCFGDLSGPAGTPDGLVDGNDINKYVSCRVLNAGSGCGCANLDHSNNVLNATDDSQFVAHLLSGTCGP